MLIFSRNSHYCRRFLTKKILTTTTFRTTNQEFKLLLRKAPQITCTASQQLFTTKHEIDKRYNLLYEDILVKRIRYMKWAVLIIAVLAHQLLPGAMFVGVTTALLIHYPTRRLVYQLYFDPKTENFLILTWPFVGMPSMKIFHISHLKDGYRHTFTVDGKRYIIPRDNKEGDVVLTMMKDHLRKLKSAKLDEK